MGKKLSLFFVIVLMISLITACSGTDSKPSVNPEPDPPPEEELAPDPHPDPTEYNPLTGLQVPEGTLLDRALAAMIENHVDARPQSGLQEADIVYEIPVEGQISRFMAIFGHTFEGRIGPVRSARHYFLPFALNYDAVIAHWGQSTYVDAVRNRLGTTHLSASYDHFYRDDARKSPHNLYTETILLQTAAEKKDLLTGYHLADPPFSFNPDLVLRGENSDKVLLPFSDYSPVIYTYDSRLESYTRENGYWEEIAPFKDENTGEQVTVKNIIIRYTKNWVIDSSNRKELQLTGEGEGWYIAGGTAVPITWSRDSETSGDVYRFQDGSPLEVLPGNTWIHLLPPQREVVFNP